MKKIKIFIIICAFTNIILLFIEDKKYILKIIFSINSILIFAFLIYQNYKNIKK